MDSQLQRAVVCYAMKHAFFQAIMGKHNNEWVILTTQCIGIEQYLKQGNKYSHKKLFLCCDKFPYIKTFVFLRHET